MSGQSLASCKVAASIPKGLPTTGSLDQYWISSPDITEIKTIKDIRKYKVASKDSERKTHMVD